MAPKINISDQGKKHQEHLVIPDSVCVFFQQVKVSL